MKRFLTVTTLLLLISSCSTTRLVNEYINTEKPDFQVNKILVVGLTPDDRLQRQFESSLVKALEVNDITAIKSVDYLESPYTENSKSEETFKDIEKELLNAGFDAVLFSKVTGQESKVTIAQSYMNLTKSFKTFSNYYHENRPIDSNEQAEDYPIYNTETSLYCLCPGEEKDLIWRGDIDIVNPKGAEKSIRDYVKKLVRSLKKNKLLIVR